MSQQSKVIHGPDLGTHHNPYISGNYEPVSGSVKAHREAGSPINVEPFLSPYPIPHMARDRYNDPQQSTVSAPQNRYPGPYQLNFPTTFAPTFPPNFPLSNDRDPSPYPSMLYPPHSGYAPPYQKRFLPTRPSQTEYTNPRSSQSLLDNLPSRLLSPSHQPQTRRPHTHSPSGTSPSPSQSPKATQEPNSLASSPSILSLIKTQIATNHELQHNVNHTHHNDVIRLRRRVHKLERIVETIWDIMMFNLGGSWTMPASSLASVAEEEGDVESDREGSVETVRPPPIVVSDHDVDSIQGEKEGEENVDKTRPQSPLSLLVYDYDVDSPRGKEREGSVDEHRRQSSPVEVLCDKHVDSTPDVDSVQVEPATSATTPLSSEEPKEQLIMMKHPKSRSPWNNPEMFQMQLRCAEKEHRERQERIRLGLEAPPPPPPPPPVLDWENFTTDGVHINVAAYKKHFPDWGPESVMWYEYLKQDWAKNGPPDGPLKTRKQRAAEAAKMKATEKERDAYMADLQSQIDEWKRDHYEDWKKEQEELKKKKKEEKQKRREKREERRKLKGKETEQGEKEGTDQQVEGKKEQQNEEEKDKYEDAREQQDESEIKQEGVQQSEGSEDSESSDDTDTSFFFRGPRTAEERERAEEIRQKIRKQKEERKIYRAQREEKRKYFRAMWSERM